MNAATNLQSQPLLSYVVLDLVLSSSNVPNTNRTRVLFGSVRCGAELELTEQDLGNVLFCLFVRIAISGIEIAMSQIVNRLILRAEGDDYKIFQR